MDDFRRIGDSIIGKQYLNLILGLFLALMIIIVFWPLQYADFINYDDNLYVFENSHLAKGFTWDNIKWAFGDYHTGYWHPLTWLTLILDYRLYGANAGGYHWTNVLFHMAGSLMLFFTFAKMTGAPVKSFFIAALFAVHPLHVESVAWIAERKDVLSTFFFMTTIWAYVHYKDQRTVTAYLFVLTAYILGLMSKPMLVTLPFILLLLDYWPLGRFREGRSGGFVTAKRKWAIIIEKIPLFALSGAVSVMTFWTAKEMGGVISLGRVPFLHRLKNAIVSYGEYLRKMFLPGDLSVFYPYREVIPLFHAVFWGAALVLFTFFALRSMRKRPYAIVGWLWYLGVLFPVIGLVQAGEQGMADRYTYVSLIGISIILAWWLPDILNHRQSNKRVLYAGAALFILVMMILSARQVSYWQNSTALFKHALTVTKDNHMAHNTLGLSLSKEGKTEDALMHYQEALRIKPNYANAHNNIGLVLMKRGKTDEAIGHYYTALKIVPNYPAAHINLGISLAKKGELSKAVSHFQAALAIQPRHAVALNNLGIAMARLGKTAEAIHSFRMSLESEPNDAETHNNLAITLANSGNPREAVQHFYASLRINPNDASVHNNLGLCLANGGYYQAALGHFEAALRIDPSFQDARKNLDAMKARAIRQN